ncbi:MAG: zinc dependent phospholipase C family protein [Ruminococcus sp.]|nr:zinc dependent phospholipase C family protein [Ruminococcus sp.]
MPATYTHHIFAEDIYKIIDSNIQDKLKDSKNLLNLFSKSFDVLFFIKPKLGDFAHTHNTNLYFKNIINYIIDNNLTNNGDVLAYLYGSICHYILDSTAHPYIFYKTGKYEKTKKTAKYRGKHSKIESMIDAINYQERTNKPIYKANLSRALIPKITISKELKETINYTYLETFNIPNASKTLKRGITNYRLCLKHFMASRYGLKIPFYKLIDFAKLYPNDYINNLCYRIKKLDNSVLNLNHQKWVYPVNKNISYHYSFNDLYDLSLEKARNIINKLDIALSNPKSINKILKEIGNLSYTTGINCNNKAKMQYFAF